MKRDNKKFAFGDNWLDFYKKINSKKIKIAKKDIRDFIGINIKNKKFLDIGCGSGLSSLAAVQLGAKVTSFDIDKNSVTSTKNLKKKFKKKDWNILYGDILNKNFCKKLNKFDIIYCWGVLHHTGDMHKGLKNLIINTKKNSYVFLALYNDEGINSKIWYFIKKFYNYLTLNYLKKIFFYTILVINIFITRIFVISNLYTFKSLREFILYVNTYEKSRGMSFINDQLDWIGGYPFEVSTPDSIIKFFEKKNFKLMKIKINKGYGNNIFLFKKK
jgi:2-polyprenyl-3-methyl-5-hydroxy-6-metoxy-1,4-benzoquinol methylase